MGENLQSRRLVVILHADIVGSTILVQLDEAIAHNRIRTAFNNFSKAIEAYGGIAHEIRGDALVAEFELTTDAVSAALAFQSHNQKTNKTFEDDIKPQLRIGISLGEVIIADGTITGSGVVMAQRLEQLADPGGIVVQGAVFDTVPKRMPYWFEALGEQVLKGFDRPVKAFAVSLRQGEAIPKPEIKTKPKTVKQGTSRTSKIGMSLLGIMMLALIGIGTLILLDKPPEMRTLDYLTEKTEQTYGRLEVRFEWIPVLFEKAGSETRVGQKQTTDEKLTIVQVDAKAEQERIANEKVIATKLESEAEEKRIAEQALTLAQLELEAKQEVIEKEKGIQAERERKAEQERIAKQKKIEANEVRFSSLLLEDAEIAIVAYGTAGRISQSAIKQARDEGIKVGLLRPISLYPFPFEEIGKVADQVKRILVVEMSGGQMLDDVRLAVNGKVPVDFYGRMGGMVPLPDEVFEQIQELNEKANA